MKKGYEEVHVPAVRSVPSSDEKLVPISDLPEWTHPAFEGTDFKILYYSVLFVLLIDVILNV